MDRVAVIKRRQRPDGGGGLARLQTGRLAKGSDDARQQTEQSVASGPLGNGSNGPAAVTKRRFRLRRAKRNRRWPSGNGVIGERLRH